MKSKVNTNLTAEELQSLIKNAVNEAVAKAFEKGMDKTGMITYKEVTAKYGFSRVTIISDIEKGIIPAVACTYKNGKRYISEAMLDKVPKYQKRKKPA